MYVNATLDALQSPRCCPSPSWSWLDAHSCLLNCARYTQLNPLAVGITAVQRDEFR